MLKYMRRRRYKVAFEALSRESGVKLEGPLQGRLWEALVEDADYEQAEKIFDEGVRSEFCQHNNIKCMVLKILIDFCVSRH